MKVLNTLTIMIGINLLCFQVVIMPLIFKNYSQEQYYDYNESISEARDYNELVNIINGLR